MLKTKKVLTVQEVKDVLQGSKKGKRTEIAKAVLHENRLRFHSETTLTNLDASVAATKFLNLVKTLLPEDKYRMFCAMLNFPVSTVALTDQIFKALEKIFDGRNPVFNYEFLSEDDAEDWEDYRTEELDEPNIWKTEGFEIMKTAINSIVVVDVPEQQEGQRPEPYFYFLPISNVIDFEVSSTDKDQMDWLIVEQPDNRIAVFDDTSYRVFATKPGTTEILGEPITDNPHDLTYCPARFFWSTSVSQREEVVKKSPLSNYLGKLDMLLFFDTGNEHLNLYGRWPIYSAFAADCDFESDLNGEYCDGGFLRNREGLYLFRGSEPKGCPVCQRRRLDGPGSFIEIDPPSDDNNNADLRNPVSITTIDRASLDYNVEDIERRKMEIYSAVTGYQGHALNNAAVNEKQVIAVFESLETALEMPQTNFEKVMTWTDETVCRLRYGSQSFVRASISLGTEHFIMTPLQLMEMYQLAKESSFSPATLNLFESRYYQTEFRNNPERMMRQRILDNLDPFRHRSIEEVTKMYEAGQIRYEDYMLKVNFSSLIMRFERENINVIEFAQALNFDAKISAIKAVLETYASELQPEQEQLPAPVADNQEQFNQ